MPIFEFLCTSCGNVLGYVEATSKYAMEYYFEAINLCGAN